jgi:HEAT repeat protein
MLAWVGQMFALAGCFQAPETKPRVAAAVETPAPREQADTGNAASAAPERPDGAPLDPIVGTLDEVADLAATGAPGGIGILSTAAVGHPDPDVRREAIVGLTEHGAAVVPVLATALRDPDPRVRIEAVESLAEIGGTGAEAVLQFALQDPDVTVRAAAEETLEDLR